MTTLAPIHFIECDDAETLAALVAAGEGHAVAVCVDVQVYIADLAATEGGQALLARKAGRYVLEDFAWMEIAREAEEMAADGAPVIILAKRLSPASTDRVIDQLRDKGLEVHDWHITPSGEPRLTAPKTRGCVKWDAEQDHTRQANWMLDEMLHSPKTLPDQSRSPQCLYTLDELLAMPIVRSAKPLQPR